MDSQEQITKSMSGTKGSSRVLTYWRRHKKLTVAGAVLLALIVAGVIVWVLHANRLPTPAEITQNENTGNYKQAEEQLLKVISRTDSKPAKAKLYLQLGADYANDSQPTQAVQAYKQAAATNGMTSALAYSIANTYYFQGNKKQALVYYQKALELWPKDSPMYRSETQALQQTIKDLQS